MFGEALFFARTLPATMVGIEHTQTLSHHDIIHIKKHSPWNSR
jgi:hypothetical protein